MKKMTAGIPARGPSLSPTVFRKRRSDLLDWLDPDVAVIVPAATETVRNRDVHHPFRQDSDFAYLTGFYEPDAWLVLVPGHDTGEHWLFCRARDPEREIWDGRRLGPEGVVERLGFDAAQSLDRIDDQMPDLLAGRRVVCAPWGERNAVDQRLFGWIRALAARRRDGPKAPEVYTSLSRVLHEMRLFKSKEEVDAMRFAARVSGLAHRRAMQGVRPGLLESAVEAVFWQTFREHGLVPAYPPIVGGGENACILHYTENDAVLRDGDLLLIDAGGEWLGYAADITRSFPVSGRFSPAQRDVCEIVLAAQLAAIEAVAPAKHWNDPHETAVRVLTEGLVTLGVLQGDVDALFEDEAYKPYYMHRTGHWLGLDVHDVGDYRIDGVWRELEPGMVLTVEPGLYFGPHLTGLPEALRGIGVRIEDDVLVTREGREVLTTDCPKAPAEIEALMAGED
ncbi:MAG: Xaa-Pro aminopeptidase [Thioalkalivibrionaceae bacterium]